MICTPYNWSNKGYGFYMAAVVVISGGHGLRIEVCHSNQSKLSLYSHYFHFNVPFKQLYTSCITEYFSYKGGCGLYVGIRLSRCLIEELAYTTD